MKFRVSWWIHGAGRICRGYDVVEAEELDEDVVEELIEEDLGRDLGPPTKYSFPASFVPNLPKFHAKHRDLAFEARHSIISNWGVLRVTPCAKKEGAEQK